MIEKNAQSMYSQTLIVNSKCNSSSLSIVPNPATDQTNILLSTKAIGSTLDVFNNLGQIVATQIITEPNVKLEIASLPIGFYHVRVQGDVYNAIGKFIKK